MSIFFLKSPLFLLKKNPVYDKISRDCMIAHVVYVLRVSSRGQDSV